MLIGDSARQRALQSKIRNIRHAATYQKGEISSKNKQNQPQKNSSGFNAAKFSSSLASVLEAKRMMKESIKETGYISRELKFKLRNSEIMNKKVSKQRTLIKKLKELEKKRKQQQKLGKSGSYNPLSNSSRTSESGTFRRRSGLNNTRNQSMPLVNTKNKSKEGDDDKNKRHGSQTRTSNNFSRTGRRKRSGSRSQSRKGFRLSREISKNGSKKSPRKRRVKKDFEYFYYKVPILEMNVDMPKTAYFTSGNKRYYLRILTKDKVFPLKVYAGKKGVKFDFYIFYDGRKPKRVDYHSKFSGDCAVFGPKNLVGGNIYLNQKSDSVDLMEWIMDSDDEDDYFLGEVAEVIYVLVVAPRKMSCAFSIGFSCKLL